MNDKIEKAILDYFKIVNPLQYENVKIEFLNYNVVIIRIDTIDPRSYYKYTESGSFYKVDIEQDMENMFPYHFKLTTTNTKQYKEVNINYNTWAIH